VSTDNGGGGDNYVDAGDVVGSVPVRRRHSAAWLKSIPAAPMKL
jgi:hypothetical protein